MAELIATAWASKVCIYYSFQWVHYIINTANVSTPGIYPIPYKDKKFGLTTTH